MEPGGWTGGLLIAFGPEMRIEGKAGITRRGVRRRRADGHREDFKLVFQMMQNLVDDLYLF